MMLPFSLARVGPLVGLMGGLLALLCLVLPLDAAGSEVQGMVDQGMVDLLVGLVLLSALAALSFGGTAACFFPRSPVLRSLGLLAAIVGLLAQLNVVLFRATMYGLLQGGNNLLQVFAFLFLSGIFPLVIWLSLLGFLLSGWGITRGAHVGGSHGSVLPPPASFPPAGTGVGVQELTEKKNRRPIERQQVSTMIAGVLIYGTLSHLFLVWNGPADPADFEGILPAVVFAVFLGIASGPWVGLVTGGIGSLLVTVPGTLAHLPIWILSNVSPPTTYGLPHDLSLSWPYIVGSALVGFLAGLPLLGTPKWGLTVRSVLAVTIRSTLAIALGFALAMVLAGLREPGALMTLPLYLICSALPTLLVALLLSPVLLALLQRGTKGKSETATFPQGASDEPAKETNGL